MYQSVGFRITNDAHIQNNTKIFLSVVKKLSHYSAPLFVAINDLFSYFIHLQEKSICWSKTNFIRNGNNLTCLDGTSTFKRFQLYSNNEWYDASSVHSHHLLNAPDSYAKKTYRLWKVRNRHHELRGDKLILLEFPSKT